METRKNFLSNNAEISLRLLYSGHLKSEEIPNTFFGEEEKQTLVSLNLIAEVAPNSYQLTENGIEVIETGKFIIKYPLHNEGVVMNFVDILNSYSKEALRALGLSIINTETYKRWGRFNNVTLLEHLQDTVFYYNSFEHPTTRINLYKDEIAKTKSTYEKVLMLELEKIKRFILHKPIRLCVNKDGERVELIEYISIHEAKVKEGEKEILVSFDDLSYALTSYHIEDIINQYYSTNKNKPNFD